MLRRESGEVACEVNEATEATARLGWVSSGLAHAVSEEVYTLSML